MIESGTSETRVFDERSPSGNDYLAEVCREWEATALKVNKDVRLVLTRNGIVLGKEGGALGTIYSSLLLVNTVQFQIRKAGVNMAFLS